MGATNSLPASCSTPRVEVEADGGLLPPQPSVAANN